MKIPRNNNVNDSIVLIGAPILIFILIAVAVVVHYTFERKFIGDIPLIEKNYVAAMWAFTVIMWCYMEMK